MTRFDIACAVSIVALLLIAAFIQGIKVGRRRERQDIATPPNVQPPLPQPAPVATPSLAGMLTLAEHQRRRATSRPQHVNVVRNVRAHQPPRDRWLPS